MTRPRVRWVKMREDLHEDERVLAIAERLRLDIDTVLGKLFRAWAWANHHARDGVTRHASVTLIDTVTRQQGFAEAMSSVGWLDIAGQAVCFPNWGEHNWAECQKSDAQLQHERELARARQQRKRDRQRAARHGGSVTNHGVMRDESRRDSVTNHGVMRDAGVTDHALPIPVPNTEENKTPPDPLIVIPPPLDTVAFRAAWQGWLGYRAEIRKPLKPKSLVKMLEKLAAFGPEVAVRALDESVAAGWLGVFPEKIQEERTNGRHGQPVGPSSRVRAPEGKYDDIDDTWLFAAPPEPGADQQAPPAPGEPPGGPDR